MDMKFESKLHQEFPTPRRGCVHSNDGNPRAALLKTPAKGTANEQSTSKGTGGFQQRGAAGGLGVGPTRHAASLKTRARARPHGRTKPAAGAAGQGPNLSGQNTRTCILVNIMYTFFIIRRKEEP